MLSSMVLGGFAAVCFMAAPALADQTINVPCAGNPSTSGPKGLVNAVLYANAHPSQKTTINVQNNCAYDFSTPYAMYDGSDTALPQITSTIVIQGQGGPDEPAIIMRSVASGTPAFRLIDIGSSGNLTLNSIQVSNGLTPNGTMGGTGGGDQNGTDGAPGGGIFSSGVLTLQDSVVSGNATGNGGAGGNATGGNANGGNGGDGAGVYNNGGKLTTNGGGHISGNATGNGGTGGTSTGGNANGGRGGNGGGVYTASLGTAHPGTTNLHDNTNLTSNSTGNGGSGGMASGSANGGNGGNGGSSYSEHGSTVTINGGHTNVEVSNTGTGGSGGTAPTANDGSPGDGGGLFTSGVVSTNGTNFTENVAGGSEQSTSGTGNGGGLAAENGAHVTIKDGSFTWNVAGNGGAVYHDGSSTVTVSGTKFAHNSNPNCSPPEPGCPATD